MSSPQFPGAKKRWRVDLDERTATHASGLVVRFEPAEDGGLDGEVIAGIPDISTDRATAERQANGLARLLREAGEVYAEALDAG